MGVACCPPAFGNIYDDKGTDMQNIQPKIGQWYKDITGKSFEVISYGTAGVIIEYDDGQAELIEQNKWDSLQLENEHQSVIQ